VDCFTNSSTLHAREDPATDRNGRWIINALGNDGGISDYNDYKGGVRGITINGWSKVTQITSYSLLFCIYANL